MKFLKWLFRERWEYSADGETRTHLETGRTERRTPDEWGDFWL